GPRGTQPRTGEKVAVPPKRVVTFKMGKVMKQKVAAGGEASPAPLSELSRPAHAEPPIQPPAL
ncbi:MAG: HU family DNA-binding protein, partial [Sphingomonadales bacterium]|nr:HU family DNA-binding protein [Sphingomonadales bacterium]